MADDPARRRGTPGDLGRHAPAFLLAQVGGFAAMRFAERLAALDLAPPHAGVIRLVALDPGVNQRTLGARLGVVPSRLVALIDQLEQRGLVERRRNPDDRRNHALHLTAAGLEALQAIARVAREHEQALLRTLDDRDRAQLAAVLRRLAEDHGLTEGVHPGFQNL
jgi:DNA-binding MarR family transcriptional regulator